MQAGSAPGAPATTGLTEAEVVRRRAAGQGNPAPPATSRTYLQIVRENVFTFINDIIILLGVALALAGRPVDALISLVVISTNIVVSVTQEVRAKRTLDRIALLTRPTARVIRDGTGRAVGPEALVLGDLLEIGAGDQVVLDGRLVDGRLEVDESQLTGESDLVPKAPGDEVFSGSFAITGTGRYLVEKVGAASLANRITAGARSFRRVLTPLQREINQVIRATLLIVAYLEILLVLNSVLQLEPAGEAIGEASLLVGLVPNGLFVSIAVAYALGAVRIARQGALVQQANAIESLSSVDVLCLDKTGTLTANRLLVTELVPLDGSKAELRAVAGAAVASASSRNKTAEAIAVACPAEAGPIAAEVPFSSVRKWSAVAFSHAGSSGGPAPRSAGSTAMPTGIVAMGAPQSLRPYLADVAWPAIERAVVGRTARGLRVLLVAVASSTTDLVDTGDATRLPELRPLGLVCLQDELRDGAAEALASFRASGVRPIIISGDDPDTVAALARQAGLGPELRTMSGPEIDRLDGAELAAVVAQTDIFGRIVPAEKERLIAALKASGHYVAMIGDGVNDVLSLKQANLAVAMQSGTQAARGVADIVLTEDSFATLVPAVREGQRILNGMQGILALFLTRITTVGLLIVSSLVVGIFPIALRNGSLITLLTVGVPAAVLAFWAHPGARERSTLGRTIARIVVPAAALSSLIGLAVLYGTLGMHVLEAGRDGFVGSPAELEARIDDAIPIAQSALTAFLVLSGLALIAFVEPPFRWLAVVEERREDGRPFVLAVGLAVVYVVVAALGPARQLFALTPLGLTEVAIVAAGAATWIVGVREVWRRRLIERFVGIDLPPIAPDRTS